MSAARHLLLVSLKNAIEKACITDVASDDPTRVDIVSIRRVYGSYRIAISVLNYDPLAFETWGDKQATGRPDANDGIALPARDTSGPFVRVRGSIMVQANLADTGEDAEEADRIVQEVVARTKWAIRSNLSAFCVSDGYGESIFDLHIVEAIEIDSGGETSQITREFIRWSALSKAKENHT